MIVHPPKRGVAALAGIALLAIAAALPACAAEHIKIGTLKLAQYSPVFIAQAKGYFAAEGLDAELVMFESAEPAAVAVVSGDLDFGIAGTSAGLFTLAGQGALRIIGGSFREAPGFRNFGFTVSNRAFAAGLKSYKDLPGHTMAVTQIGSPTHYNVALIAEKFGLDLSSIHIVPVQSLPNELSAVKGGQVDATLLAATLVIPAAEHGDVQLLGWAGDETPWQFAVLFAGTKTANDRHDTVEKFLRAYKKGARDYYEAFTGADGKRQDGPTAPQILALIAKFTGQPAERIETGISYVDPDARLDVKDVLHQIQWYKSQGMVKGEVEGDQIIDKRYVVPLPPGG